LRLYFILSIIAILIIAGLEGFALSRDINGIALSASVGAIGGIVGWNLKGWRSKVKNGN